MNFKIFIYFWKGLWKIVLRVFSYECYRFLVKVCVFLFLVLSILEEVCLIENG